MTYDALEDFAGPGGWSEGLKMIGLHGQSVGIEWDMAACQTAKAAGHARIRADVAAYPSEPFVGIPGYIASPPCQAWSMAGKRKGEHDRANCHVLADRMAAGDDSTDWTTWEDERSALVCQPVRRVRDLRPEWIALEEVPEVAGLWQHFARIFRGWGYSTWVGVLNAADYGVPQSRRRAILMASRTRRVEPPVPTHSRDADEGDLFGASREGWVSMATALGWALTEKTRSWLTRPAATIVTTRRSKAGLIVGRQLPAGQSEAVGGHGWDGTTTSSSDGTGVPVTAQEAAVLQSFPADYPWQGSRSKQYEQIGNAVPPLLAAHVLAALTGKALERAA